MAISVAKQYYPDLNSLQNFEYIASNSDPMEFSVTAGLDEIINRNNFGVTQNHDLQGFVEQAIDFVESSENSPQDSSWSPEYQKFMHVQNVDIHQGHQHQNKKRRMDWDSLELNNSSNNGNIGEGIDAAKVPHLVANGKDRDSTRSKTSSNGARLGWPDDIDFDLNGDLTNNSYLNNDSFLSLSSALTVLKQEIPSPSSREQIKKSSKANHQSHNKEQSSDITQNDQQLNIAVIKSVSSIGTGATGNTNNSIAITAANNNNLNCQFNGNSNSSASNDLANGLENIAQNQQQHNQGDQNIDRNDSNNIKGNNGQSKEDKAVEESKFQYVLAAATSIATKNNEETITYLNQGQSYEIKLKKLGDLTAYRGKILKSVVKICFHERRLQYMEREQMHLWQASRPGERIIEIDVPLSYGLCHVAQPHNPNQLNIVEVLWDPMKEVGVYIKINCISTEFTPKKHGGEKGVPFRIQIETYIENTINANGNGVNAINAGNGVAVADNLKSIHAAACQIKVFKLKGADRKHKQDREKIQKRPPAEKEKYQPSYECTILTDIPNDILNPVNSFSPEHIRPSGSPLMSNSPIHMTKFDGIFSTGNSNGATNPIGINSVSSSNSNVKLMDQNIMSPATPQQAPIDSDDYNNSNGGIVSSPVIISKDTTPLNLAQWLNMHRLGQYVQTFSQFSGADLLRMTKEDLIQICGLADGIRMYNTLHSKAIAPRLTIYVSFDGSSYHAIYLHSTTAKELVQKMFKLPGFNDCLMNATANVENNVFSGWNLQSKYSGSGSNLFDSTKLNVYINGPAGIHVYVTDEVLNNIKDDSLFSLEFQNNKVIMKIVYKNEIN